MVLDHISQGADLVIIGGASPDSFCFTDGNLDMIDVFAIPDRLEHAIGEAQHHQILNRLFSQIMINAKDLRFIEHLCERRIDLFRGFKIVSDRLFYNHPAERLSGVRRIRQP